MKNNEPNKDEAFFTRSAKPEKPDELRIRAAFEPTTFNEEKRTVELTWSTGADYKRYDWNRDRYFIERLKVDKESVDLSRLESGAPLLANHSRHSLEDVIGVVERAWIDKGIGKAVVRFSERESVAPILADVKAGILRSISVGYSVETVTIEERQNDLPIYTATRWTPQEISLVTIPADVGAQVRSIEITNETNTGGVMPETTEIKDEAQQPPSFDVEAVRAKAIEDERQRVSDINHAVRAANLDEAFAQKLITENVSADMARKMALDEMVERAKATPTHTSHIVMGADESDMKREAAVNSILARGGFLKSSDRIEKLKGNPYAGLSLRELARDSLERGGEKTQGLSDHEMVKRAITSSTSDFPIILDHTTNSVLLSAYTEAAHTWKMIAKTGSVTDFRKWNRIRTAELSSLDEVDENGEYRHKKLADGEMESLQIGTFGNIVTLSRKMIINDDLGAWLDLTASLGKAAALTIEKAVYALLLSNPVMADGKNLFHADHGNLISTGSVISTDSLDAMRVGMAKQKSVGGEEFLDIRPDILLCPTSMGGDARVVVGSEYDPDTPNKLQRKNKSYNVVSQIVDTPRLTGNAWYMLANPNDTPTLEVAFLDGNEQPFIDSEEGFTTDGTKYKVRLDFGVGVVDYRSAQKNVGA